MNYNEEYKLPSFASRVFSVWYRHFRVYASDFFSNAFPPFIEPFIFLAGVGMGLGGYIQNIGEVNYVLFLASALIVSSAMYTAAFECTYGTYMRLEVDRVYDGILGATISPKDIIIGEILFLGTKGFFYSGAILLIISLLGIITTPMSIFTLFIGFIAGIMFSALSLLVTSLIGNMNHFNFYFTGLISPMFFFSGIVFPVENLPNVLRYAAEIIPLTHVVRLARAFCITDGLNMYLIFDLIYCIVFSIIFGWLAIRGIKRRMIV